MTDEAVTRQVLPMLRSAMSREVGRGSSGGETIQARANQRCDYVDGDPFLESDRRMEAAFDDVCYALVDHYLDLDVWAGVQEVWQNPGQHIAGDDSRSVSLRVPTGCSASSWQTAEGLVEKVKGWPKPGYQAATDVSWHDAADAAIEQAQADSHLKTPNHIADSGGRPTEVLGGWSEPIRVNHGGEQLQVIDVRCCQSGTRGGCWSRGPSNSAHKQLTARPSFSPIAHLSNRLQVGTHSILLRGG